MRCIPAAGHGGRDLEDEKTMFLKTDFLTIGERFVRTVSLTAVKTAAFSFPLMRKENAQGGKAALMIAEEKPHPRFLLAGAASQPGRKVWTGRILRCSRIFTNSR